MSRPEVAFPFTWLRSWPSGHVHAVSNRSIERGEPLTYCGICWPGKVWTGQYSPGCATCPQCEKAVGARLPHGVSTST